MSGIQSAETACAREPKSSRLTRIINDMNEIRDHVSDIHSQLGARSLPNDAKSLSEPEQRLDTLVDVIDNLPDIIRRQKTNIHRLLDEIKESLI